MITAEMRKQAMQMLKQMLSPENQAEACREIAFDPMLEAIDQVANAAQECGVTNGLDGLCTLADLLIRQICSKFEPAEVPDLRAGRPGPRPGMRRPNRILPILTRAQVAQVRDRYAKGATLYQLFEGFNITQPTCAKILAGTYVALEDRPSKPKASK